MNKPLPRKQRVLNRGYLYTRTADDVGELSVKLIDIDSAILYYFDSVIQPSVKDNGENVKVPIMYASPERWKAIQRDGFMKDKKRQIITPVIAYRRTSIEKDDTIPQDKLDANNPNMFYTFEKRFTQENRYDNFNLQQGILPQKEYYNVTFPDYVVLNYDFTIWTTYIEQMNKIVEKVIYSDGAYWGDPEKLRFRSKIESFTDATEVSDVERLVRTTFSVTLRGYLLPDGNYDHRSTTQKFISPKKITFGTETDTIIDKQVGRAGQFREGLVDSNTIPSKPTDSTAVATELTNPISFNQGTGITLSPNGISFDGSTAVNLTLSIGQSVGTTDNVTFNAVSASALVLGDTTVDGSDITGDLGITGSVTLTGDFTVNGNATIGGTVTAQEFHTEFVSASIIFESGSTRFGDTIDDTHNFTGSLDTSGSFSLNGYEVTEISNDTTLGDESATALVTENAAKTYIDTTTLANQAYLRKSFFKKNVSISGVSTASFNAVTASAPTGLSATNENDFVFFINGQYMEHDAVTIQQSNTTFLLKVDNSSIGYDLESDDEIIAIGKFNS
tara:strand:- start:876 stop:2555 length:1680 start_codon:yes stop_codon:yes gene_type:complete